MKSVGKWLMVMILTASGLIFSQWPDDKLNLIACDVGQGDAVLITLGFNQILIDGGPNNGQAKACLGKYLPFWDRKLELVVATHPESDHIGGLSEIISLYKVDNILLSDIHKPTQTWNNLVAAMQKSDARVIIADTGMQLKLGDIEILVLNPEKDETNFEKWYLNGDLVDQNGLREVGGEVNGRSVVLNLTYKAFKALLVGDIEAETEAKLLAAGNLKQAAVLKAAHHGSKTSTTQKFLETVRPELAVISVGKNNRYGHPSPEILARLKLNRIDWRRTDERGAVVIVSDGVNYTY